MATQRQRVAVTLSDETREIVQRLADLEGTSMSKIIAGIVESFAPTAQQLVTAMEAAQNLPEEKRLQLVAAMEQIEPELLVKTQSAQSAFSDALDLVETVK